MAEDVRVSGVGDRQDRHTEVLSASRAEVGVGARVVVDRALGEHREVLDLRLAEGRAVVGDEHHLRAGAAHGLDGGLVSEGGLAGLHHQLQPSVHALDGLLLLGRKHSS